MEEKLPTIDEGQGEIRSLNAIDGITLKFMANRSYYEKYMETNSQEATLDSPTRSRVLGVIDHLCARFRDAECAPSPDDRDVQEIDAAICRSFDALVDNCVSHLHFVDRVSEEPLQTNAMHAKMYSEDTEVKTMTMDMFVKSKRSLRATKEAKD